MHLPSAFDPFLILFKALWPCLLLLALFYCGRLAWDISLRRRLAASGVADIDQMDGRTFERYLETLFLRLGYRVELTRYIGDWGADLVVMREGIRTAVQAKRWKKPVGVGAIQEAVAAKGKYHCADAMVVTNSTFTRQARELARANGVVLRDRDWLVMTLLSLRKDSAPSVLEVAPNSVLSSTQFPSSADDSARCAVCGRAVSEKVAAYCRRQGPRFGGRTYCFDHQKNIRHYSE